MTTVILGDAEDKVCLDHATFMLLDNYQKDPGLLQPETAAGMREIDQKWDRVTTANIGTVFPSGFYATLYKPKDGTTCPPTLALRGTVFDDARGIALAVRLKAYPAFSPETAVEFDFGFAPGYGVEMTGDHGQGCNIQIDAIDAIRARLDEVGVPGFIANDITSKLSTLRTLSNLIPKFGTLSRLTSSGSWIELFGHQGLNTRASTRMTLIPASIPIPADYREVVVEIGFELWLNRDEGDWAANVIQGIGQETSQYGRELMAAVDDAIITARECDNQLRITGHSLGGGMASAAAIYAKENYPDVTIYGLGYDAAGVHVNTADRLGTSLDMASEAKVVCRAVEDEVLTSMEKPSDFVPLASSLIRFTGSSMPPPIGTYVERKGVSPGPIGNAWEPSDCSMIRGGLFAPKWAAMPNLLEVGSQDVVPWVGGVNPVATWANLASQFAAANNMSGALTNLNAEIMRRVEGHRDTRAAAEELERLNEAASERADAAREAAAESAAAAAEAADEAADAAARAQARAAETRAEAAEPDGILGYLYNRYYDNPRDAWRTGGEVLSEVGDELGDAAVAVGDEIRDVGREAVDEIGDGLVNIADASGDLMNFAYENTFQYMVEFVSYGIDLAQEAGDFGKVFMSVATYHDMELAAFTFAVEKP